VLRALELQGPKTKNKQVEFLAKMTGLSLEAVASELDFLVSTEQVQKVRTGYRACGDEVVDTGADPERARSLKLTWTRLALERLAAGAPGHVGYTLFSVSRSDLVKIRQLQLDYVRALSMIIFESSSSECVGLYTAMLMDLAEPGENTWSPAGVNN
jgi:hypothetical protein